jgi:hypothetical protein
MKLEAWQRSELTDYGQGVICEAFVEGTLEAPENLARTVYEPLLRARYEEFGSRTGGATNLYPL